MQEIEFNLLTEPWVRVRLPDNAVQEVSLTDALVHAQEYMDLAGEMPTQDAAMLRLLLAVLFTVFSRVNEVGEPLEDEEAALERWGALWELKHFPEQPIRDYLEQWKDRFWLFHPERPFWQVPEAKIGSPFKGGKLNGEVFESENKMYGDNVFEKDGIRRDRTGDGEKTRCLCGKRGIFNRDGPAMGPQIIRQLERRASRRSASFFHALASPGRPRNGGGASGAYQPAEGRKTLIQGHFRAQEGPLGPSRKSQQQTKRTGFAALEDSIADEAPEGKRAKRANRALNCAGINSRGQKQGFGGADRRGGRFTSR